MTESKEAAKTYCDNVRNATGSDSDPVNAFQAGAQWKSEQSPWIDINDISVAVPNDKVCLIRLENGVVVRDTEEWQDEYPLTMITHWMLIPECP